MSLEECSRFYYLLFIKKKDIMKKIKRCHMWFIDKIKKSLKFKKNKKNYEKNLKEYEALMKNKIGYLVKGFEVLGEAGISFEIYTENFIIDYTIWESENYKINKDFEKYGDISKFVSKDKKLNTDKRDAYYANTTNSILNDLKNKKIKIFNDKQEIVKELENESFNNIELKYFPHIKEAMDLIIDDFKKME